MTPVRRAAVAGSWYPANRDVLEREVDAYLRRVDRSPPGDPIAIIAPHAGLIYSGPIAAYSYNQLRGRDIDVAVLVGPSHYVAFEGVAVYDRGAFDTPMGPAVIDEACVASLFDLSSKVKVYDAAHAREHSLEMQLPFLKRVLPAASIVPLVMGNQSRETAFELGDAIASSLANRRAVIVASTDLSHYQNAVRATELDNQVIEQVLRFDPEGLMSLLEANPAHACGGGPTVSVMHAARALGAKEARVLKYGDSGDVSGDKNAVVGYLAASFGTFEPGTV